MSDKNDIGSHYRWVEERRRKAQAKLDELIDSGASRQEIADQRERVINAGNTGD